MSVAPDVERALRYRVLPVFLVLDAFAAPGAAATVPEVVVDTWARHPALSDTLRLCVLDLGVDVQVRLPVADPLAPQPNFPTLPARSGTPGSGALDTVRSVVEAGARALDADGLDVQPPLVWTIIGTAPDDTWSAGLEQLTASATRPVVVSCCFGAAAPEAVGSSTTHAVFAVDRAVAPAVAVAALTEVLTAALVRTGHALGATGPVELPADDELPALVTRAAALLVKATDPQD